MERVIWMCRTERCWSKRRSTSRWEAQADSAVRPEWVTSVQDGMLLVQVKGHFQMGGSGPLAMGPQGAGPPTAFQEVFTLCLDSSGRAHVLKQSYTTV